MYNPAVPPNCSSCVAPAKPYTLVNTNYTCTPYDIGPPIVNPITGAISYAQCSCSDSLSCSSSVWSSSDEVMATNQCDGTREIKDCNESADYFCDNGPNGVDCYKHYKTSINMSSTSPVLGQPVTVAVYGSNSCADNNPIFSAPNGLVYSGDYRVWGCQYLNNSCDMTSPSDKACQWNYSCNAYATTSSSTATFNTAAFLTDPHIGDCFSSQNYSVVKATSCNPTPYPDFTGFQTGEKLMDPYYNDDSARKETYLIALEDPSVVKSVQAMLTITPTPATTPIPSAGTITASTFSPLIPPIGVSSSLVIGTQLVCMFANLAQQYPLFQAVVSFFNSLGYYCPEPTYLVNGTTNYEVASSKVVIDAERPQQVVPTPAPKSCSLADDTSATTEYGNTKLNHMDTYWGGSEGIYTIGMPPLTITPRPTTAFVVNNKVLIDDKRVGNMESAEGEGMTGWYPVQQGIVPLSDPTYH